MCRALAILTIVAALSACDENVLVLPESKPARVRIVNVTQDVAQLEVSIDKRAPIVADRGASVVAADFPAGTSSEFYI